MVAGRKPKPTKGTYRPDRANPSEPMPRAVIPPCPEFLQGEARKQYQKTAKKLARIGLMTELDDMALSMVCQGWADYLEPTDEVKRSGMLVKSPNGFPVLNPYLIAANQAIKKVRSLLAEFGMTPASRSRIHAAATSEESDDEWSKLLK